MALKARFLATNAETPAGECLIARSEPAQWLDRDAFELVNIRTVPRFEVAKNHPLLYL